MVSDQTYEFLQSRESSERGEAAEGYTYPPSLVDALRKFVSKPGELSGEDLRQFLTPHGKDLQGFRESNWDTPLGALGFHYLADSFYRSVAVEVRDKLNPDLFMAYLKGIDRIEHHFWRWREPQFFRSDERRHYSKVIDNYYVFTDSLVKDILGELDDETLVFIVSDHGHGAVFNHEGLSGSHGNAPNGIFIAYGPGIHRGRWLAQASVLDIAPTILAAMGLPVAKDMDGKVLRGTFTDDFFNHSPISLVDTYGPRQRRDSEQIDKEVDAELIKRLRSLGYIQ